MVERQYVLILRVIIKVLEELNWYFLFDFRQITCDRDG